MTTQEVANLLEQIAEDKAAKIRTMTRSTTVLCTVPIWARREEINALFGVPPQQLLKMVLSGGVRAKKLDPELRGSAVIFNVEDVRRAIDDLTDWTKYIDKQSAKAKEANQ